MLVVIGCGGNLGDPPARFEAAVGALSEAGRVVARSRLYRSRPIGPQQPQYWNMAALLDVDRPPIEVLDLCQLIEERAGRVRDPALRWGPRPLDVDLLLARDLVHRGPRLQLPHIRLHERAFALVPAAELAAEWTHPLLGRSVGELADEAVRKDAEAVWRA